MQQLHHFFHSLALKLNHQEQLLQILASIPQFEPFTTFRRLDQDRNGQITKNELQAFFADHQTALHPLDLDYLFSQIDLNQDGKITYTDFGRYILPSDDKLKLQATQRSSYYIDVNMLLPDQVEQQLKKILEQEILNYREINTLKDDLLRSYEYNIDKIQADLDLDHDGIVSDEDLEQFLSENHISGSLALVAQIKRKFDKDDKNNSGGLNLQNMMKNLSPQNWEQIQAINNQRKQQKIDSIPLVKNQSYSNNLVASTQLSQQPIIVPRAFSPQRDHSLGYSVPINPINNQFLDHHHSIPITLPAIPQDFSLTHSLHLNPPYQSVQPIYQPPFKFSTQSFYEDSRNIRSFQDSSLHGYSHQLPSVNFDLLVNFFNLIVNLNKELEISKQKLDFQSDFNIQQLFHFFTFANTNIINETSFLDSLVHLRIEPSQAELQLFWKLIGGTQINYQQFCNLILPQDSQRNHIAYSYNVEEKFLDFSFDTLQILAQLFIKLLNNEGQIEDYRRMHKFSQQLMNECFQSIDEGSKGYFSLEDLTKFLQNHKIFYTNKENKNLYERIDRNKDWKVCQQEFILELVPLPY